MPTSNDSDSEDEYTTNEIINYCPITSPNTPYSSLIEALEHDDQKNNFKILDFLPSPSNEDFFEEAIVTINKCRSFVQMNFKSNDTTDMGEAVNQLKEYLKSKSDKENDEEFFRPVLQDDAFLMHIDDLEDLKDTSVSQSQEETAEAESDNNTNNDIDMYRMQIQTLKEQLKIASSHMPNMTTMLDPNGTDSKPLEEKETDIDSSYFSSYSHSSIHETMLQDKIRTEAYQNAILNNPHMFENKVVMDIGCGTGILSLFAAKAGAKKVISIDASDMCKEATEIVQENGYEDVIHVVFGKVEDLIDANSLPLEEGEKVDVVISEWMGYALFYETMLPSVMVVRDKLMNPTTGTMWPNRSIVFLEGATDSRLDYWSDVYGFKMTVMKDRVTREVRREAGVEIVSADDIVTNRCEIVGHDLNTCRDEELDFDVPFELTPSGSGGIKIDKLVISFDIDFDIEGSTPTSFSTGCQTQPTHWKQTTMWFEPNEGEIVLDTDEVLKGTFRMGRNDKNPRDMDILVQWEVGKYTNNASAEASFEKRMEGIIVTKLH